MKLKLLFCTIASTLFLQSCWWHRNDDPPVVEARNYEPIVVSRTELENISLQAPKTTVKNAKIYLKDQFLFVNDDKNGFHLIDNSNPASPQKIHYLKALGSTDVAIRNNVLYVNQARDLVALKINSSTNQIQVLKRLKNVFPPLPSPEGQIAGVKENEIVIDWKLKN